jgi:hypothetical protein
MNEYREEIVAKLANDVSRVLEHMADAMHEKFQDKSKPSFEDFNNAIGEATNEAIKDLLDSTKEEIHKHGITIEELMAAVRSKNPDLVAKEKFENEDGTSGGDRALGNTYVQERSLKITNKDFTIMMKKKKPKDVSPLKTVFSDDDIAAQWVCSLRDDTVIPSFIDMAENYEMTPDAQVTSINYIEGADEHAICKVLTIFEPHLKSKEDSKIETIIRGPIDTSKAAIEVHVIRALSLVAVITYVNGFCIEMRYHRISKGKISKSTCFIADDKEDNDEWLIKQRDRAQKEAKNNFIEEVLEGVKEGKYPIIHKDDLDEITELIRRKAEERSNESPKPKEGHTNNRIKFYDN